jgi:flagellar basal body P-ring formation protein FlgA
MEQSMKQLVFLLVAGWMQMMATSTFAQTQPSQDFSEIARIAKEFLQKQTTDINGEVSITIGQIDSRLKLQMCSDLSPFLLQGSKAWGKITLGIRCQTPKPWTIYVGAQIKVKGAYYVSAQALSQGQVVNISDLAKVNGDLTALAPGAIIDPAKIVGRTMQIGVAAGTNLRLDMLKVNTIIQQGQVVKITSVGPGFSVSNEALALNNAAEGQIAKAKTASGYTVSGVAKVGGIIEIPL